MSHLDTMNHKEFDKYMKMRNVFSSSVFLPPTLLCDFYKVCHKALYPQGTETIYSTFTPRSKKYFPVTDGVVVFGIQAFIKKYLIKMFNEEFFNKPKTEVVKEYTRVIKYTLGVDSPDSGHIEQLHDLGYLPIRISALKEGTYSPIKVPVLTIENTHKDFFWLTNYLETLISTEIWMPMTSATTAYHYRKLLNEYALKTTGSTDGVEFQLHDFSMRGMSSLESAMASGAGHLLSSYGTDTIPAILYLEGYYNANIETELVGTSIVATEHSIMSSLTPADGDRDETEAYEYLLKQNPSGFLSIVSDTYDFWKVIGEVLPKLKDKIMTREGRVVIRPDSGVPEDIICGKKLPKFASIEDAFDAYELEFHHDARLMLKHDNDRTSYKEDYEVRVGNKVVILHFKAYKCEYEDIDVYQERSVRKITLEDIGLIEALWNIFGGTVTPQGYKVLDPHIGAIYGDSITLERAKTIVERLEAKGFASTNIVLGIGSFTYQMVSRDTAGFAMKATYAEINGEPVMLFKDPKTDDGTKRSQRGRVVVFDNGNGIQYQDGLSRESEGELIGAVGNLLETVFENGVLKRDQSLPEIRQILHG